MRKTFEFEIKRVTQEKDGERVAFRLAEDRAEDGLAPSFALRLSGGKTAAALGYKAGNRVTITLDIAPASAG